MSDLTKTMKRRLSRFRRKYRLFVRQNGQCYWCYCKMMNIEEKMAGHVPANYSTIDHLDEKFTGRRGKMEGERTVLACKKCNSSRSNEMMHFYKNLEVQSE